MTQRILATFGGASGIVAGFVFWPVLQDDFWKFLAVALPSTISIVVSVLSSWKKLRELFVKELAVLLRSELEASTNTEIERIEKVFERERESLAQEVTDQVWYRIDTINKLTEVGNQKSEIRGQKSEIGNEESFDLQKLAAK